MLGFHPRRHSLFPSCALDGISHHGLGDGEIAYATPPWDAADRSNTSSYIPSSDQVLHSRIFPISMWPEGSILSGMLQLVPQPWYETTFSLPVAESLPKVVILLRACLGLSPEALRKLSAMVFRLAFMPCLAESFAGRPRYLSSYLSSGCSSSCAPGTSLAVGLHARVHTGRCQPCCRCLLPSQPSGERIRCEEGHPNACDCCR